MKKHSQNPTNASTPLFELEDHPMIHWISEHGKSCLYAILGVFVLLLAIYLWLSSSSTQDEVNYQQANGQFQNFEKSQDPTKQEDAFLALTQILNRQPALHAKYDGLLAQTLIDRNQIDLAKPFAEATLTRVSQDQLPYYQEYSQLTLLITQNQLNEAIKGSLLLKEKMLEQLQQSESEAHGPSFGGYLFALNFLRTAFLQQKAKDYQGELKSWQEWKSYTDTNQSVSTNPLVDRKALFTVSHLFKEGSLSLDQYIDMRIKAILSVN